MNYKHLLLLLALVSLQLAGLSQDTTTRQKAEQFLKQQFGKIPLSKYMDLVPFFENEKIGYLDKKTNKVLIPVAFDYEEEAISNLFFHPQLSGIYKKYKFNVESDGKIFVENKNDKVQERDEEVTSTVENSGLTMRSFKSGFKGFTVSKEGYINEISDLYTTESFDFEYYFINKDVVQLFNFTNHYYAIVQNKKKKYGVIDSLGNPLKGFDFNYSLIVRNNDAENKDAVWFFVRKEGKNFSLINTNGDLKFKDEIFSYPFTSYFDAFGFVVITNGEKSAIFDRLKMQWVINPQMEYKINRYSLAFSSSRFLNRSNPKKRSEAKIYYLVQEGSKKYFMDLTGKKYLPIK